VPAARVEGADAGSGPSAAAGGTGDDEALALQPQRSAKARAQRSSEGRAGQQQSCNAARPQRGAGDAAGRTRVRERPVSGLLGDLTISRVRADRARCSRGCVCMGVFGAAAPDTPGSGSARPPSRSSSSTGGPSASDTAAVKGGPRGHRLTRMTAEATCRRTTWRGERCKRAGRQQPQARACRLERTAMRGGLLAAS
jgi:hypothetical protein